jgi:hypothetical protein
MIKTVPLKTCYYSSKIFKIKESQIRAVIRFDLEYAASSADRLIAPSRAMVDSRD